MTHPHRDASGRFAPAPRQLTTPRYTLTLVREAETPYVPTVDTPASVVNYLCSTFGLNDAPNERMVALYLDNRRRPIGTSLLFQGTINRAACEPRQILATGLLLNAASVVLAHNHPSGDPTPSAEDRAFTRRVSEAGALVGVRLVDHVVIGSRERWSSLRRSGEL